MKKSELVTLVAEKTGFSKKDTERRSTPCLPPLRISWRPVTSCRSAASVRLRPRSAQHAQDTIRAPARDQYCSGHYAGVQAGQSFEG